MPSGHLPTLPPRKKFPSELRYRSVELTFQGVKKLCVPELAQTGGIDHVHLGSSGRPDLPDVDPEQVRKLDSVQFISQLRKVGQKVGDEVKIENFGSFIQA
jgi:hypothetical protein